MWCTWLSQQLQKTQVSLANCLTDLYQQAQERNGLWNPIKLKPVIQSIQQLMDNDPLERQNSLLTTAFNRWSLLLQDKDENNLKNPISLLDCFKEELATALKDYQHYYESRGKKLSKGRLADVNYLQNLLTQCNELIPLREGFVNYYQTMQPTLLKWIPVLDTSYLRYCLKRVLDNPNYSAEQLTQAALAPASSDVPVSTLQEDIKQLEKHMRRLTNKRVRSNSFFTAANANDVDHNVSLRRTQSMP